MDKVNINWLGEVCVTCRVEILAHMVSFFMFAFILGISVLENLRTIHLGRSPTKTLTRVTISIHDIHISIHNILLFCIFVFFRAAHPYANGYILDFLCYVLDY